MRLLIFFFVFLALFIPYFLKDARYSDTSSEIIAKPALSLSIYPASPLQGQAVLIRIGETQGVGIDEVTVGTTTLNAFSFGKEYVSLYGIDLRAATGTKLVSVAFADGRKVQGSFVVLERSKETAPLGIPQKLGGNTAQSQTRLVGDLGSENAVLDSVPTTQEVLWSKVFLLPLASTSVTDAYGYSRLTGNYSIAHKGTDFRAAKGTEVFAMNDGVVRLTREFRVYGKTIVVDHGLGVHTFYMHLSHIGVSVGEKVEQGQPIGLSGDSGYAESPHLHVSVRVNGISVDPIAFIALFEPH